MAETNYALIGDPVTPTEGLGAEILPPDDLEAVRIVAENIDAVIFVAENGASIAADVANSASAAAGSATSALAAQVAAEAAQAAAAGSASSASASSVAAANSAVAAANSASNAAVSAAAAAAAVVDITLGNGLVPNGGLTGQALRKNSNLDFDYGWQGDPPFLIGSAGDFNPSGLTSGQVIGFDGTVFKGVNQTAATTFASLTDVAYVAPQVGQYLRVNAALKVANETVAPGGGGTGGILDERPNAIGPTTLVASLADFDKVTTLDCTGGPIEVQFPSGIAVGLSKWGEALYDLVGTAPSRGVTFRGGITAPAMASLLPAIAVTGATGVNGTPITNANNTPKAAPIPAGNNLVAYVIYGANPANTAAAAVSTGFDFNGVTYAWDVADDTANAAPHTYFAAIELGTIAAIPGATFKPNWVDYGGNGNVNSYAAVVIFATDASQIQAANDPAINQNATAVGSVATSVSADVDEPNRIAVHGVFRRGNSLDTAISVTGAVGIIEGDTGTALNSSALRYAFAVEPIAPGGTSEAAFTLGVNAPQTTVTFKINPVPGAMLVQAKGNVVDPVIARDGLVGALYSNTRSRVEIAA